MVALAINSLCPAEALLAPDHVGNVGDGAARLDVSPQAIGVIGFVGDDDGILPKIAQKEIGAGQVVGLAWSEPSAASPNTTISTLFLTPEAC